MHGFKLAAVGVAIAGTADAILNQIAQSKGKKYFGSATDNGELTDAKYVKILSDNTEFGQLTPANAMKVCFSSFQHMSKLEADRE